MTQMIYFQKAKVKNNISPIIKKLTNILRRNGYSASLEYIPELSRLLFLKYINIHNIDHNLPEIFRWDQLIEKAKSKDIELNNFFNSDLIKYFENNEIDNDLGEVLRNSFTSKNEMKLSDLDEIRDLFTIIDNIDLGIFSKDDYTVSRIFEDLLLKLGDKGSDAGQYFTPRDIVRFCISELTRKNYRSVYDPCCGTGGFIIDSLTHCQESITPYGVERDSIIYPILLQNLYIHNIDIKNFLNIDTIKEQPFRHKKFDLIATNPPFGGLTKRLHGSNNDKTQNSFMEHVMERLSDDGTAIVIIDDGFLSNSDKSTSSTREKLLENFKILDIVRLPAGTFSNAGASVYTSILHFSRFSNNDSFNLLDLTNEKVNKKHRLDYRRLVELYTHKCISIDLSEISNNNNTLNFKNKTELNFEPSSGIIQRVNVRSQDIKDLLDNFQKF